ncbi:MAG: 30S ribosomal protein S6 [Kiritimatiellae bacterium]|nr:30S ribosomal protein S6 [Kiritimatiellia bacterium]
MSEQQKTEMNRYEGLYIFPESVREEALDEALGRAKEEIEKLGGQVESAIRLGRRTFARRMQKQGAGYYAVIAFRLAGGQIAPLMERYRLAGEVFRVQINCATAPEPSGKETEHAVAE